MTVAAVAALAVAGMAAPALAHVEVKADKTTAGATDVTVSFNGEAENPKAGIKTERVVLPDGIAPDSVTPVKLPPGWSFSRGADGFTVGGKALKVGTDSVWSVKIAKLPDGQTRLSFKTLETYGDGQLVRWIEIQEAGQPEPDNPAPLLVLKPGPSAAATPSTVPATTTPGAPPPAAAAPAPAADSGGRSAVWIWLPLVVLVIVAAGVLLMRRRRG